MGRALVTLEEISTILMDLEAIVNDRPLTYVSGELDDLLPLTPNHLFRGRTIFSLHKEGLDLSVLEDPTYLETSSIPHRFRYISKLSEDLRRRYYQDYLTLLRESHRSVKFGQSWPNVGDVVLIHGEGFRLYWKMGIIIKLFLIWIT